MKKLTEEEINLILSLLDIEQGILRHNGHYDNSIKVRKTMLKVNKPLKKLNKGSFHKNKRKYSYLKEI